MDSDLPANDRFLVANKCNFNRSPFRENESVFSPNEQQKVKLIKTLSHLPRNSNKSEKYHDGRRKN